MIKVREDLTNQKFGKLTVLKQTKDCVLPCGQKHAQWLCKCDCGNEIIVRGDYLKSGHTQSCGCYAKERISETHKKYSIYDLSGEYGIGYTPKGDMFLFDIEDYDKIKDYSWHESHGYIYDNYSGKISMHRVVLGVNDSKKHIDHINHNTAYNRKSNLRIVTSSQNQMNKRMLKNNTSGTTGVTYSKRNTNLPWVAQLWHNNIREGKAFATKEEAINQRKIWEQLYYGEYSYDNSINKGN